MRQQPSRGHCSAAFPDIPQALIDRFSIGELSLRPFGICPEDLAIDFNLMPRPLLEAEVVSCCILSEGAVAPAEDFFLDLEVGTRIQCLIVIASLGEETGETTIDLRCLNQDCRQDMEIELSVSKLAQLQKKVAQNGSIKAILGSKELAFRRPTGRDQLYWLGRSFESSKDAAYAIAETLAVGGLPEDLRETEKLSGDWLQEVSSALKASDPLSNFAIQVGCPDCGRVDLYSLDLGEWALGKLRQEQDRLIDAIHTIAYNYHWIEDRIAAIPLWRRSRYIAKIEKEEAK